MPITQISTELAGQFGSNPGFVQVVTTDDFATITSLGYFDQAAKEGFIINETDFIFINYNNGNNLGVFTPEISNNSITINEYLISSTFSTAVQKFTSNGTYTPASGMVFCRVDVIGGGGAGGGTPASGIGQGACAGGGGGGGYSYGYFSAATIGASKPVTIGAGGTGVANGAGGNGGVSSFGGLLTANGGSGGSAGTSVNTNSIIAGGAGASVGSGTGIFYPGNAGSYGLILALSLASIGGTGGQSGNGLNGAGIINIVPEGNSSQGFPARANTGCGGSGSSIFGTVGSTLAGGNGADGFVIVTEYILQQN